MKWLSQLWSWFANPPGVGRVILNAATLLGGIAVLYSIVRYRPHFMSRFWDGLCRRKKRSSPDWIRRINDYYEATQPGTVELCALLPEEPVVQIGNPARIQLSAEQEAEANALRELWDRQRRQGHTFPEIPDNDGQAVLMEEPHWANAGPTAVKVQTLDYAERLALISAEPKCERPRLVSANVVMLCREERQLILHWRSSSSLTKNSLLHTPGGCYMPPGFGGSDDGGRLSATMIREVFEETKAAVNLDEHPPILALNETDTGFLQVAFLGVNISKEQLHRLLANQEGTVHRVGFDDLERALGDEKSWVPTGKATILAWLALGAPNANAKETFGGLTAIELFNRIVPKTDVPQALTSYVARVPPVR